jgi:prepilin-type N-terminal cleavage/methylation domain-containing protein
MRCKNRKGQVGFSLVELMVVSLIVLVVAGYAIPSMLNLSHMAKLRGSASDFGGLVQQARIRSVQDDRSYALYINPTAGATPSTAYVDLKQNGAIAAGDPEMLLPGEITLIAAANAPATANLKTQMLPAGTPVLVGPYDAALASATPITFSPRGLPCLLTGGVCTAAALGPTAYWAFFQNTSTTAWEAVTISPAGRIQKWSYSASAAAWNKLY